MKIAYFVFALAFLVAGFPTMAKADLDQMCLKQCISAGQGSSNCLGRCTYGSATAVAPKPFAMDQYTSPNRVFGRLQPAPPPPLLPSHPAPVASVDRDYVCLNQCVHGGSPYQMCEARCAKPTCGSTAVLCSTSKITAQSTGTTTSGTGNGVPDLMAAPPR